MSERTILLTGKNAVVTGAGAGIGRAIALAFAKAGAQVACLDLDAKAAEATARLDAAKSGRRAIAVRCDVGSEDDVTQPRRSGAGGVSGDPCAGQRRGRPRSERHGAGPLARRLESRDGGQCRRRVPDEPRASCRR